MPKIPRISGERPGGASGGRIPTTNVGGEITNVLGDLVDVGYGIAHQEEARLEKMRLQKQAIVDEVEAGRRAGDYEESLVYYSEDLKKQFQDAPDKAPQALLEYGRKLIDQQLSKAPNSQVGLEVAQRANARLSSAMREMHNWTSARQTQKAKGDLSITVNRATAAAEGQTSVGQLDFYIKSKVLELTPTFQKVLGTDGAITAVKAMRSDMARAWALSTSDKSPQGALAVIAALDEKSGPLVDYLDTDDRKSLRGETKQAYEGRLKAQELNIIKASVNDNSKLSEAFLAGDASQFASLAYASRRALEEQKNAVAASLKVDQAMLAKAGISLQGYSPEDVPKLIEDRITYVDALSSAWRRQATFDAPDDPASVDGLMRDIDKALGSKTGKEMKAIAEQQKNVAVALDSKKISGQTAASMFRTMSLAMKTASENQEDVWGWNSWKYFREPRDRGIVELNRQFSGNYAKLDERTKMAIRLNYEGLFNEAVAAGNTVNKEAATKMALRALAYATHEPIPGAE